MGVKESATKEDIATAPAITILNSLNSLPVIPSRNTMGINTETSVMVVEIMAKNISFDPAIPASKGVIPFSIFT